MPLLLVFALHHVWMEIKNFLLLLACCVGGGVLAHCWVSGALIPFLLVDACWWQLALVVGCW